MPAENSPIQIASYGVCFQLERRLHRLDRWRIPVPYGVPMKGLIYGVGALLAVLVLSRLPVFGAFLGTLHPWLRYVMIPGAVGWAAVRWKIDGRSAPATIVAWLRWCLTRRRLVAFRASAPAPGPVVFGPITIAPDELSARARPGVIEGAGTVIVRYPSEFAARGRTLRIVQQDGAPLWRGKQVRIHSGQRGVVA